MERLTNDQLEAIRKRAEAATEGPWETALLEDGWHVMHDGMIVAEMYRKEAEDAEFIAHARTDIPKLLAEIERLRKFEKKVTSPLDVEGVAEDGTVVKLKNVVFDFSGGGDGE